MVYMRLALDLKLTVLFILFMAQQMRFDDEIRINILDSLLKKRSVIPNINHIQSYT
ncbi:MAG: hypothetical protein US19_C0024G0013, partial [Candidatus Daviesbacteria bacterium GW2011_GWB1_36_5]